MKGQLRNLRLILLKYNFDSLPRQKIIQGNLLYGSSDNGSILFLVQITQGPEQNGGLKYLQ